MGADFVSATGRKFLRGPRGTGFLYASDAALDELEPFPLDLHSATWTSEGYEVQESARRFEYWEKSYATILGMGAAIDYALDCGIAALADRPVTALSGGEAARLVFAGLAVSLAYHAGLFNIGAEVVASTPAQLDAYMRADMAKMGKVIKDAGIHE